VEKDDEPRLIEIPLPTQTALDSVRSRLDSNLEMTMRDRTVRVVPGGGLTNVTVEDLPTALAALTAPTTLNLDVNSGDIDSNPSSCGNDHICAVNLSREVTDPPGDSRQYNAAVERVCSRFKAARGLEIRHFIGGPCDDDEVVTCIVPGGSGRGWTVHKRIEDAMHTALARGVKRVDGQGAVGSGQVVRLHGLKAASHLNGELGVALRFDESAGRWGVRLRNGEGKRLKPTNLQGLMYLGKEATAPPEEAAAAFAAVANTSPPTPSSTAPSPPTFSSPTSTSISASPPASPASPPAYARGSSGLASLPSAAQIIAACTAARAGVHPSTSTTEDQEGHDAGAAGSSADSMADVGPGADSMANSAACYSGVVLVFWGDARW
jgi:hypothetical protein